MGHKRIAVIATSVGLALSMTPLFAQANTPMQSSVSEPCTITGTAQSETLIGTPGDDVICGLGGNDIIRGLDGDDIIRGGDGNDTIFAGKGDDAIEGGAGKDLIEGGAGNDSLEGESGNDKLVGGAGDDVLLGDAGRDDLSSGAGDDALSGDGGVDSIRSGSGDDTCASDLTDRLMDSCTMDMESPSVVFPDVNLRDDINLSEVEAGSTAVFRWIASDASGVYMTWASVGGPPGWIDWCGFATPVDRIDGTAELGTYELSCNIPETAVNEKYTLFVGAADTLGNNQTWTQFEFNVVNGSSDNQIPEILDIRFPSTLEAGDTFTVEVDVVDESGTLGIYAWFIGAPPYYYYDENGQFVPALGEAVLVSGDAFNGTFRQTLQVSTWTPPGVYTLMLSIRDTVGNRGFITTEYSFTVTQ
jgi:hypothetical protein